MKKVILTDTDKILDKYLGEQVTIFCCRYIYTGKLIARDDSFVILELPKIVYETGAFSDKKFSDAQSLCVDEFCIAIQSIESFGTLNKE